MGLFVDAGTKPHHLLKALQQHSGSPASPATVLLGDSMFERLTDSRVPSQPQVIKQTSRIFVFAAGGDRIANLMLRLDMARSEHAFKETSHFIIMVGINNLLGNEGSPDDVARATQGLVDYVHGLSGAHTKAVHVCTLLKVKSCTGQYPRTAAQAAQINRSVDQVNVLLQRLQRCTIVKVDVPPSTANLLEDGLHLTSCGMERLAAQLPLPRGLPAGAGAGVGAGGYSLANLAPKKNQAGQYATKIMKGESAMADPHLQRDYELLTDGQAIYLTEFLSAKNDFTLMLGLVNDLEANAGEGMINWSQHLKHENPDFSATFNAIVEGLGNYFDLHIYATRLNFYPDASSWKPFHHDSHAYGGKKLREDFTVGASFGATRALEFKHERSGHVFGFPQNNGDIFAFTTKVNQQFLHGVPKVTGAKPKHCPRFSIIAWGRRRTITERNGGKDELGTRDHAETVEDAGPRKYTTVNDDAPIEKAVDEENLEAEAQPVVGSGAVADMVREFVQEQNEVQLRRDRSKQRNQQDAANAKLGGGSRRKRVQGGWDANRGRGAPGRGRARGQGRGAAGHVQHSGAVAAAASDAAKPRRAMPKEAIYSDDDDY